MLATGQTAIREGAMVLPKAVALFDSTINKLGGIVNRVSVYPYMVLDCQSEKFAFSLRPATEDAIRKIEGARPITALGREVDSQQVNENGFLVE
jgi:hypothetical protein